MRLKIVLILILLLFCKIVFPLDDIEGGTRTHEILNNNDNKEITIPELKDEDYLKVGGRTYTNLGGSKNLVFKNGKLISGTLVSSIDSNEIKINGHIFTLGKGNQVIFKTPDIFEAVKAEKIQTRFGSVVENVEGYKIDAKTDEIITKAEKYKRGWKILTNLKNVKYDITEGTFRGEYSETITDGYSKSTTNNARNYNEGFTLFEGEWDKFSNDHFFMKAKEGTTNKGVISKNKNGVETVFDGKNSVEGETKDGTQFSYDTDGGKMAVSTDEPPVFKIESGIFSSPIKGQTDIVHLSC